MYASTAVLFLALITTTTANEILADTFQQISTNVDMRDEALFQLIIGTIAIFIISICVMGFMLIFQCYTSYCAKKDEKKYNSCPTDADIHQRTLSFRSVFQEEA